MGLGGVNDLLVLKGSFRALKMDSLLFRNRLPQSYPVSCYLDIVTSLVEQ